MFGYYSIIITSLEMEEADSMFFLFLYGSCTCHSLFTCPLTTFGWLYTF